MEFEVGHISFRVKLLSSEILESSLNLWVGISLTILQFDRALFAILNFVAYVRPPVQVFFR